MMAWLLQLMIRAYQVVLGPMIGDCCRFHPSCSVYFIEALEHHGFLRGCRLGLGRLVRCHPLHPGGLDPVPGAPRSRGEAT
jgi:uncharacterized protein